MQDQDLCGRQPQCGQNPGVDGLDRHAGVAFPATESHLQLGALQSGGAPAATTLCPSRPVGLAGSTFSTASAAARPAVAIKPSLIQTANPSFDLDYDRKR